jgi:hypothetical protein
MTLRRSLVLAGMFLLFGAALPVQASLTNNSLTSNSLTNNSLTSNAITSNALVANGTAVAELNGVTVDEISLPQGVRH